eukprot:Em0007g1140a
MEMLSCVGVGPHTREIIKDIYTDSNMCVKTANGLTAPIRCDKGVKQGCPPSPILFNFVMEPTIRAADSIPSGGYTIGNHTIRSLAYADDLCVLTQSTNSMQEVLQAIQSASNWAGLHFNPRKCGTLTLSRSASQFAENFSPTLNDELIPSLKWEDHYKYLGCKVGGDYKAEAIAQGKEYVGCCKAILEFGLTDWQKLDAIHSHPKDKGIQYLEQTVPGDPQGLKPDIVLLNDSTSEAFVIDVTVPFEGPEGTLEAAKEGKVIKYSHLREVLAAKGYQQITDDAFVIGSL